MVVGTGARVFGLAGGSGPGSAAKAAGAVNARLSSLLVLTGVATVRDLIAAPAGSRPDFIGRDLRALQLAHPAATEVAGEGRCGPVRAVIVGGEVRLDGPESAGPDGLDGLRSVCALAWSEAGAKLELAAYDHVSSMFDLK